MRGRRQERLGAGPGKKECKEVGNQALVSCVEKDQASPARAEESSELVGR